MSCCDSKSEKQLGCCDPPSEPPRQNEMPIEAPWGSRPAHHHRWRVVERGLRFSLGAVVPLVIGLYGAPFWWKQKYIDHETPLIGGLNFAHFVPMIYLYLAALAPPFWAGIWVSFGPGFLGLSLAFAIMTVGLWAASHSLWAAWGAFSLCVVLISPMKVGLLRPGLRDTGPSVLASLAAFYIGVLFFVMFIGMVNPGFSFDFEESHLKSLCNNTDLQDAPGLHSMCGGLEMFETLAPQLSYLAQNLCLPAATFQLPSCTTVNTVAPVAREAVTAAMHAKLMPKIAKVQPTLHTVQTKVDHKTAQERLEKTLHKAVAAHQQETGRLQKKARQGQVKLHRTAEERHGGAQDSKAVPAHQDVLHSGTAAGKARPKTILNKQAARFQKKARQELAKARHLTEHYKPTQELKQKIGEVTHHGARKKIGEMTGAHAANRDGATPVSPSWESNVISSARFQSIARQELAKAGHLADENFDPTQAFGQTRKPSERQGGDGSSPAGTQMEATMEAQLSRGAKPPHTKRHQQMRTATSERLQSMNSQLEVLLRADEKPIRDSLPGEHAAAADDGDGGDGQEVPMESEEQILRDSSTKHVHQQEIPMGTEEEMLSSPGEHAAAADDDDGDGQEVPMESEEQILRDSSTTRALLAVNSQPSSWQGMQPPATSRSSDYHSVPRIPADALVTSTFDDKEVAQNVAALPSTLPCLKCLQGQNVTARLCHRKLKMSLEGGSWFISTLWTESWDSPFGVVQAFLAVFVLGFLFFALSLLLPFRSIHHILLEHFTDILNHNLIVDLDACMAGNAESPTGCKEAQLRLGGLDFYVKAPAFEPGCSHHGVAMIRLFPPVYDSLVMLANRIPHLIPDFGSMSQPEWEVLLTARACLRDAALELQLERPQWHCSTNKVPVDMQASVAAFNHAWGRLSEHPLVGDPAAAPHRLAMLQYAVQEPVQALVLGLAAYKERPSRGKEVALGLASAIGPALLPLGVMFANVARLLMVWRWGRFWNNRDFQVIFQHVVGFSLMMLLPILDVGFRQWGSTSHVVSEGSHVLGSTALFGVWAAGAGAGPSWTVLGFITCHTRTVEGTAHRCLLRWLGTLCGGLLGWLGLLITGFSDGGGTHEDWKVAFLTSWICVWCFVAVVLGAHTQEPLVGFNRSYGYGLQVITYTMAIIIIESWGSDKPGNTIAATRVLGQTIGIGVCLLTSLWVFPGWAAGDVGLILATVVDRCQACLDITAREGGVVQGTLQGPYDSNEAALEGVDLLLGDAKELLGDSLTFAEIDRLHWMRSITFFKMPPLISDSLRSVEAMLSHTRLLCKTLESAPALPAQQQVALRRQTEFIAELFEVTRIKFQSGGRDVGSSRSSQQVAIQETVKHLSQKWESLQISEADHVHYLQLNRPWALYSHELGNIAALLIKIMMLDLSTK